MEFTLNKIFEQRGEVIAKMKQLPAKAKAEKRELTADEKRNFSQIDAEYKRLSAEIEKELPGYCAGGYNFVTIEPLLMAPTKELREARAEAYQTGKSKVVEMLNVFLEMREAYVLQKAAKSEPLSFEEKEETNYTDARVAGYSW